MAGENMIRILVLLIIASVCGAVGAKIAGTRAGGCLASIALGFIGALIGTWLSRQLDVPDFVYFHEIPLIWSIIGSALFVTLINLLSKKK
jgi:uncharacterized membrane protein YeaQ/YmgE (transglycosylase-associated protein family)